MSMLQKLAEVLKHIELALAEYVEKQKKAEAEREKDGGRNHKG